MNVGRREEGRFDDDVICIFSRIGANIYNNYKVPAAILAESVALATM